jgi:hypothetical protein
MTKPEDTMARKGAGAEGEQCVKEKGAGLVDEKSLGLRKG